MKTFCLEREWFLIYVGPCWNIYFSEYILTLLLISKTVEVACRNANVFLGQTELKEEIGQESVRILIP
jgi:hypothetical protein